MPCLAAACASEEADICANCPCSPNRRTIVLQDGDGLAAIFGLIHISAPPPPFAQSAFAGSTDKAMQGRCSRLPDPPGPSCKAGRRPGSSCMTPT